MRNIFTLATLLLTIVTINAQNSKIKFSKNQLNDDFNFLVTSIINTHPNPYTVISQKDFKNKVEIIKEHLNDSLTLKEFYRLTAPFVASLKDGHTKLGFPGRKILDPKDYLFPFAVKTKINEPYLVVTEQIDSTYNQLPIGAEITSINNVSSKKIIEKIIENTSGESEAYRLKMGADFNMFGIVLDAYYDFNSGFYDVQYKNNQKLYNVKIQAVTIPQLMTILQNKKNTNTSKIQTPDFELILKPEIKTAIINFTYMNDEAKFESFLKDSFQKIKENNITNLVIDIRENGGGNSALGNQLLKYISKVPFSQYKETIIKYSQLQKDIYKSFCNTENVNCNTYNYIKTKPNNTFETIEDLNFITPNLPEERFNGKVFLLTSTRTYSSAMNFAQAFKYYKIGEINGEETGGWVVSYGDFIPTELPNTKLKMSISSKKFYTIGTNNNDLHGVKPDNKMKSENALDYTLNKIKTSNSLVKINL